jgi:menaquinone-9 beta-reductase
LDSCDVLIVGGGPAGSACARALTRAGRDVVVMDAKSFPRDKVCAGWITPQVIADVGLDVDDYRRGRTFQAITAFRTGLIGGAADLETVYDRPVSWGIRRCEFDHYLLQHSGARLRLGDAVATVRRDGARWIVNEAVAASMLVGAGGHFCPVARMLSPRTGAAPVVVAQETEFPIAPEDAPSFTTAPSTPELYFSRDLKGYGWCFRKQEYVNVGFGSLDRRLLPQATAAFVDFLRARGRIPAAASWRWRGHAYLLAEPPARRAIEDGVLLIGDAAGLAYPQSGEGIRPAIESGLIAASAILDAGGRYGRDRLASYEAALRRRFGASLGARLLARAIPNGLSTAIAPALFRTPWFVRHVLIDRWFLHAHQPSLA